MHAVAIGEPGSDDPAEVGHKAATLARLAPTFRVPPGFSLTTGTYSSLKRALEPDGAEERAELMRLIEDGYGALSQRVGQTTPRVAVRSSAVGEDSADASFAGQHETMLNLSGVPDVVGAVLDCWRSLEADRVTAYRRERGIEEPPRMAVFVQQMVDANVSAIAFGADPVSGDQSVVVIDAAAGLGDRIASGEITPDRYVVRKSDVTVHAQQQGGALTEEQARDIARLVLELEHLSERPVDVECAIAGAELYLLQCRPITTLSHDFVVEWEDPKDAELNWTRDDAHSGAAQPQLMNDLFKRAGAYGFQHRAEVFDAPMLMRVATFNGRMYVTLQPRVAADVMAERTRAYQERVRTFARTVRRTWDDEYLPSLREHYAWMSGQDFENAPLDEVAVAWEELIGRIREAWTMHMMVTGGAYPIMNELAETYARLVGAGGLDALKLTQGRTPTLHRLERDLNTLVQRVLATPAVAAAVNDGTVASLGDLRSLEGGAEVASAIDTFLEVHGDLGHAGEDLRSLSWADDHALLFAEIGRRISAPLEDPDARVGRLLAESRDVEERARAALRDRPEDLATFDEVLATARAAGPLTEEHNYWLDRKMSSHAGRLVRALGARAVREGLFDRPDDIYHLRIGEIAEMLRDRQDRRALVRERVAEYARWRRMRAPKTLGSAEAAPAMATRMDLQYRARQQDDAVIKGIAASSGVRRGAAKLVRGTEDFKKLRPGDVLVCRSSNVSWIPLFTIAAAVVTDVGGALSHAAVVAREFGVPAVTGVGVAFERLRDGMLVEVDGDAGTVRAL